MSNLIRAKIRFNVPFYNRNEVRRSLLRLQFFHNTLKTEFKENKNLLSSDFFVTIQGEKESVMHIANQIKEWCEDE